MSEHNDENERTPLDRIRVAERLIRDRAGAAMTGPWEVLDSIHRDPYVLQKGRGILTGGCIALASGEDYGKGNAEHIATWDPMAALAVADWLRQAAMDLWAHGPLCECGTGCDACDDNLWESHVRSALALAEHLTRPGMPTPEL